MADATTERVRYVHSWDMLDVERWEMDPAIPTEKATLLCTVYGLFEHSTGDALPVKTMFRIERGEIVIVDMNAVMPNSEEAEAADEGATEEEGEEKEPMPVPIQMWTLVERSIMVVNIATGRPVPLPLANLVAGIVRGLVETRTFGAMLARNYNFDLRLRGPVTVSQQGDVFSWRRPPLGTKGAHPVHTRAAEVPRGKVTNRRLYKYACVTDIGDPSGRLLLTMPRQLIVKSGTMRDQWTCLATALLVPCVDGGWRVDHDSIAVARYGLVTQDWFAHVRESIAHDAVFQSTFVMRAQGCRIAVE